MRSSFCHLLLRPNKACFLSISPYFLFSSPPVTVLTLQVTSSSLSLSVLYWRGQNWMKYSKCMLSGAEERGKIASIDFLTSHLLVELSLWLAFLAVRAHHWIAVHRSFSWKLLSVSLPQPVLPRRLFHPRCRTSHLLLLNFMMFLFSLFISPACRGPSEGTLPSRISKTPALQQFLSARELAESALHPVIPVINIHRTVVVSVALKDTTNNWPPVGPCIADHSRLTLAVLPIFHSPLQFTYAVCSPIWL